VLQAQRGECNYALPPRYFLVQPRIKRLGGPGLRSPLLVAKQRPEMRGMGHRAAALLEPGPIKERVRPTLSVGTK
jgi:hypothetical protein